MSRPGNGQGQGQGGPGHDQPPIPQAATTGQPGLMRRASRSSANTTFSMEVFDNEVALPSCSLLLISSVFPPRPRLSVLGLHISVDFMHLRHRLDPISSGRGVRQFKTGLLQRLERVNASSLDARVKKTDAREIEIYYGQYYENYVRGLDKGEQADRLWLQQKMFSQRRKFMLLFNILPLDSARSSQAIMQLEEVEPAVGALLNTCGLNFPSSFDKQSKSRNLDVLDWLRAMFGFQSERECQEPAGTFDFAACQHSH